MPGELLHCNSSRQMLLLCGRQLPSCSSSCSARFSGKAVQQFAQAHCARRHASQPQAAGRSTGSTSHLSSCQWLGGRVQHGQPSQHHRRRRTQQHVSPCCSAAAPTAAAGQQTDDRNDSIDALEADGSIPPQRIQDLSEQFAKFDADGNGVIDKTELRVLLEAVSAQGEEPLTAQHWVVDAIVDSVMASFDSDGNNGIDFSEFVNLMQDSVLLDGKLREYQAAFQASDVSGNGTLGGAEVRALFEELGHPLSDQKLFDIMEKFDESGTGQLGFNDFLDLFRDDLLEAQEVVDYIRMKPSDAVAPREPSLIEWTPGEVMLIFSGEELEALGKTHPQRVIVLEASFTWCRPCKGFQRPYERFAEAHPETIFLKFFGNSNQNTKMLFQSKLQTPMTPHFTFWREGQLLGQHSGASRAKLYEGLQKHLQEWDNPIAGANKFKQQVWSAKLLGGGHSR